MPKYGDKERAKPYSSQYREWSRAAKNGDPSADGLGQRHTLHIKSVRPEPNWDELRERILKQQRRHDQEAT